MVKEEDTTDTTDTVKSLKDIFNSFVNDETKELINNFSNANHEEKAGLLRNFLIDKQNNLFDSRNIHSVHSDNIHSDNIHSDNTHSDDIDELVIQKRQIEERINLLSDENKNNFWVKYHNIPNDINEKIDVLISSLTILNSNINEKFDDINTEITILKKQIGKPV